MAQKKETKRRPDFLGTSLDNREKTKLLLLSLLLGRLLLRRYFLGFLFCCHVYHLLLFIFLF